MKRLGMWGRLKGVSEATAKREEQVMDEGWMEYSMEELREFLDCDVEDVPVDPEFKERLRRKLWKMVSERAPVSRQED